MTDDGRPVSPIAPGTPHGQEDAKNRSVRQLRSVTEDLEARRSQETLEKKREERLQSSIQATLKSLSRKVEKSVRLTDSQRGTTEQSGSARPHADRNIDRSPDASPKRSRPPKPNKFWKESMQESVRKVPKNETAERLPQNRQGDVSEPADKKRAPRFPGLEDFLNQSPDDPSQTSIINSPSSPSQQQRKSERKTQSPTLDLDGSECQDPP